MSRPGENPRPSNRSHSSRSYIILALGSFSHSQPPEYFTARPLNFIVPLKPSRLFREREYSIFKFLFFSFFVVDDFDFVNMSTAVLSQ